MEHPYISFLQTRINILEKGLRIEFDATSLSNKFLIQGWQ
jgi:hypothetical protein